MFGVRMTYHFCTYFDRNYLLHGLTLYRSLVKQCDDFKLYVLCLDDTTYETLNDLNEKRICTISLKEIEEWSPELLQVKPTRGLVEYYFTLSPVLPLFILEKYQVDIITYLDADLLFFSSPDIIYNELGSKSILITPHRFPPRLKYKEKYGLFNIQYQSFRNDEVGLKCLERWKCQCLEWCFDRLEDGKFADQKYLDEWPRLYDELVVSQNNGVGVAPWNIANFKATIDGNIFSVSGCRVVFYHFHGFKILGKRLIYHALGSYEKMDKAIIRWLYFGYVNELALTHQWLENNLGDISYILTSSDQRKGRSAWVYFLNGVWKRQLLWLNKKDLKQQNLNILEPLRKE